MCILYCHGTDTLILFRTSIAVAWADNNIRPLTWTFSWPAVSAKPLCWAATPANHFPVMPFLTLEQFWHRSRTRQGQNCPTVVCYRPPSPSNVLGMIRMICETVSPAGGKAEFQQSVCLIRLSCYLRPWWLMRPECLMTSFLHSVCYTLEQKCNITHFKWIHGRPG